MSRAEAADAAYFIFQAEPKLLEWTRQTLNSYALYVGANEALRDRIDPGGVPSQLADRYREQAALMTVLRVYSLFDRKADVSFQVVKRLVVHPEVQQLLVENYVGRSSSYREMLEAECRASIDAFLSHYATLEVPVLKRLHHFRNLGLAHVTLHELRETITYDELGRFVRLAGSLAAALTLAARSHNTRPIDDMEELGGLVRQDWENSIAASKR